MEKYQKLTKIYSINYNKPEFIYWQFDSFYKFFVGKFQYIIVNNAKEAELRQQINQVANNLQLDVIETHSDTDFSLCGKHHADAMNDVWNKYIINDKEFFIFVDSDLFLLKAFDINKHMNDHFIVSAPPQHRKEYEYLTPTITIIDLDKMPNKHQLNWEGCCVDGTFLDTGGGWCIYFQKNPTIKEKVKLMKQTHHIKSSNNNLHVLPNQMRNTYKDAFEVELFDETFLHFCRSSGWAPSDAPIMQQKEEWIKDFIYKCMSGETNINQTGFDMRSEWVGWK